MFFYTTKNLFIKLQLHGSHLVWPSLLTIFCIYSFKDLFLKEAELKSSQSEQPNMRPAYAFSVFRRFVLRSEFVWKEIWRTAFCYWQFSCFLHSDKNWTHFYWTKKARSFLILLTTLQKHAKFRLRFLKRYYKRNGQCQNCSLKLCFPQIFI